MKNAMRALSIQSGPSQEFSLFGRHLTGNPRRMANESETASRVENGHTSTHTIHIAIRLCYYFLARHTNPTYSTKQRCNMIYCRQLDTVTRQMRLYSNYGIWFNMRTLLDVVGMSRCRTVTLRTPPSLKPHQVYC